MRAAAAALLCLSAASFAGAARGEDPRLGPDAAATPEIAAPAERKDYLITSAALLEGRLSGCAGESCTVAGTTVPVAETVFIGLDVDAPPPPPLQDYLQDQVVLRDGTSVPGRMIGISGDAVVTGHGRFARTEVAWIYLLPQPARTAQPDAFGAPEERPADGEDVIDGPDGPQDGSDGGPEPPDDSTSPGEGEQLGALWAGTIHSTIQWTPTHFVTTTARVRLREMWRTDWSIDLIHEGSTVTVSHSTVNADDCTYAGSGTSPAEGKAGYIERRMEVGQNGQTVLTPWMYALHVYPTPDPVWTTTCSSVDGPYTHTYGGVGAGSGAGVSWAASIGEVRDPDLRVLDGGRMVGSYTATADTFGTSTSWSICRQGVWCPNPLDPDARQDAAEDGICPDPRNESARLDLALDQQSLLMQRLARRFDAYFRLADEARAFQDEFAHASTHCTVWSGAKLWASFVLSNLAPASVTRYAPSPPGVATAMGTVPPSAYSVAPGQEFANFLGLVEKILDDDGSWLLPNTEFGWLSAEDLWDGFTAAYGAVAPGSFGEQIARLRSCGAPTMQSQMDGAIRFLRLMSQVEPLMREVNTLLNDLRAKHDELARLWDTYRRACLDHAACAGLDPSTCDRLPAR